MSRQKKEQHLYAVKESGEENLAFWISAFAGTTFPFLNFYSAREIDSG